MSIFLKNLSSGENILGFEIKPLNLNSGNYNFSISIIDNKSKEILLKQEGICPFFVKSETYYWSNIINMISLKKIPKLKIAIMQPYFSLTWVTFLH